MTETTWPRFPVSGPRTARWVCRFVMDTDIAPRSRHVKWRSEVNLTATDESVSDHEFCARILCISPDLLEYVTDEQHKEAAVMKERRKLRDERALARGSGGGGGGGGDSGGTRAKELQSLVDKQKSEISKLKASGDAGAADADKASAPHGRFEK